MRDQLWVVAASWAVLGCPRERLRNRSGPLSPGSRREPCSPSSGLTFTESSSHSALLAPKFFPTWLSLLLSPKAWAMQ